MLDAADRSTFMAVLRGRAKISCSPDPKHKARSAALSKMEGQLVQDLFPQRDRQLRQVFLPGSTLLEKDGHSQCGARISACAQKVTRRRTDCRLERHDPPARAMGRDEVTHHSQIMRRSTADDPDVQRRFLCQARRSRLGAMTLHTRENAVGHHRFRAHRRMMRGKGKVVITNMCDRRAQRSRYPMLLPTDASEPV